MRILEVIVTYKPNIELLKESINSIINQVDTILIIDNSDQNFSFFENFNIQDNVIIKELKTNIGIAEATNIGIRYGLENGFDWVMTSDQDTIYPKDYIDIFIKNYNIVSTYDKKIVAFSPVYFDRNTNETSKLIEWTGKTVTPILSNETNVKVFATIASGLLIDLKLINQVGLMNSDLFIDWVDLDWCYRAYFYGYSIICCKELQISHCLGDTNKGLFNKTITLRNPLRHYYIIRNCVYLSLYEENYPREFKRYLHKKIKRYLFGYTYLAKPHLKNFFYLLRGIRDGKKKLMGKCSLTKTK